MTEPHFIPPNRNNEALAGTSLQGPNCHPGTMRPPAGTHLRRRAAGFTLTEMMIAVAILSVLLTGIMSTYVFSIYSFQAITNYVSLHTDGRGAVDRFPTDVRGAVSVIAYGTNGPFVVSIATNFDSSGTPLTNTVTYTFSGNCFYRSDSRATDQLATNVSRAVFTMYNKL